MTRKLSLIASILLLGSSLTQASPIDHAFDNQPGSVSPAPVGTPFPNWSTQAVRTYCFVEHPTQWAPQTCEESSNSAKAVLQQEWPWIKEVYKARCVAWMAERAQGLAYTWAHYGSLSKCIDGLATHDARFN